MESISIKLSNGKLLNNLYMNGNCLYSENEIDNDLLTDDLLQEIEINGVVYHDITLVRKWEQDGYYYIALRQKTEDELWKEQYVANLEYLAMMADIDMEE